MAAGAGRSDILSDAELDRRVFWRVMLVGAVLLPVAAAVNVFTMVDEAERVAASYDARAFWVLEISSTFVVLLLMPLVGLLEREAPRFSERWRLALVVYAVASIVFSLLHVAGMWAIRALAFASLLGQPSDFLAGGFGDLVYEYRKDLIPFAIMLLLFGLVRRGEEIQRDAAVARAESRRSGTLVLKSGGRRVFVDRSTFLSATAAGNYVELQLGQTSHLVRITLAALLRQLSDIGIEVLQVSRSELVNSARVRELRPERDGDFLVLLDDGTQRRGSRRYRPEARPGSGA